MQLSALLAVVPPPLPLLSDALKPIEGRSRTPPLGAFSMVPLGVFA
jgi:hypothetical protein